MRPVLVPAIVLAMLASSLAAQPAAEATYAGKVVDGNGQPLSGAKVNLYAAVPDAATRFTIQELGASTTAADGKFTFAPKALRAMAVIVTARKEGLSWAWFDWEGGRSAEEATLTLGKPAGLSGVVVDEAGKPVAGATLRPLLESGDESEGKGRHMIGLGAADWMTVKTDAAGKFQFPSLPADSRAEFLVDAPGKGRMGTMSEDMPVMQYAAGQTDIKLALKPEGKIEGAVALKDGKPVAGAVVSARGHGFVEEFLGHSATTDKDGKFTIAGLDEGEYMLELSSPKAVPDFVALRSEVNVESGKTASGVKIVASAGGLLHVLVTDDKGKPVPGAMVHVLPQDDERSYAAVSDQAADANGEAAFRLAPGKVSVSVRANGLKNWDMSEEPIAIEEGKTAQAKIELSPLPSIRGVVRDANGKAVEGASVRMGGPRVMAMSSPKTDANGRFEILYDQFGPPNSVSETEPPMRLVARHAERGLAAAVDVSEPNKPLAITLKPGAVLKGLVVDEEGKPIAKAKVSAVDEAAQTARGPGIEGETTTDAQGKYEFKGVSPEAFTMTVTAEGYGAGFARAEVEEGKGEVEVEKIALKAAKLTITGVVTDPNAQPVAGAAIFAGGEGQPGRGVVRTDKNGKFTIDKLVEGKVTIHVSAGKGLSGSAEVKAGDKDVEIMVEPPNLDPSVSGPRRGPRPTSRKAQGEDF